MQQLDKFRQEIDILDTNLLEILGKRFEKVREINIFKKTHQIPPLDENRKQEIIEKLSKQAKSLDLSPEFILELFELIHAESIKIQSKIQ